MKNFLITGGLGFIGSHFTNYMLKKYQNFTFVVLDKMDYCSSIENLDNQNAVELIIGDIGNRELVTYILNKFQIDTIVHFAAQTHVDNSFFNSASFSETNVLGTHNLLECCRIYHESNPINTFIHVSTDEVYGETNDEEFYDEKSLLKPTNPYAATKAAAEFLANSYHYSYKLPIIITRGNNVYGSAQYPEKVVPKFICQLLTGKKLTIQGNGTNTRNFIHIEDTVKAFETILLNGKIGEIYNISSDKNNEFSVLDVAQYLVKIMYNTDDYQNYLIYIENRKYNDLRYRIDSKKLESLNWKPEKTDFQENLKAIVDWYKVNLSRYKTAEF